jgi:CYTH domain-containing protein/thymidylate kinase
MKTITKIVLTGGPCGGKSTALSRIEEFYTSMGYKVIIISETASDLILGGIAFGSIPDIDFQTALLSLMLFREKNFVNCAEKLQDEKILIVCDRGALDNKAYLSAEDFSELMKRLNTNEIELRDNYDAVFHLVSPADGAEQFYTTDNNQARKESANHAAELDRLLIAAWTGHPHLRVIDNSTEFEEKIRKLISEISHFLGRPDSYEVERKFLIAYPDLDMLNNLKNCQKTEIIQTYLVSSNPETELRIRQSGRDGHYTYTKTEKRRFSETKRVEVEKRLRRSEYLTLLMNADTNLHQVRKTRYCLIHERQYFEIDIYPLWNSQAILKIELTNETEKIKFPDFLKILREVSDDNNYRNYSLAKEFPQEDKTNPTLS